MSLRRHAIVNNLVDELRLEKLDCLLRHLCVFMWGQLHHCDGPFQNRQWRTHFDDLLVDSLCRELRLGTTVFAGAVNDSRRAARLPFSYRILTGSPENSDWFLLQVTIDLLSCFDFTVNHLGVLLHGETQVVPRLLVHLDFVVLRHAVFVLSLWCLLCVASQLGHRWSCHCTEAVGHPSFSVPFESQAPVVAFLLECP